MVAVEEGIVALDDPVGQPGCTLRHLLAHAGGYPFDGADAGGAARARGGSTPTPGIELAADAVADGHGRCRSPTTSPRRVLEPLGMTSTALRGSPAHGAARSTVGDIASCSPNCSGRA